jgi:HJR/Mrr/RecB family endonuclease
MAKKQKTKNTKFNSVKEKLRYIQSNCKETELFEHLRQLFIARGFNHVLITHGINEYGKDLVFAMVISFSLRLFEFVENYFKSTVVRKEIVKKMV